MSHQIDLHEAEAQQLRVWRECRDKNLLREDEWKGFEYGFAAATKLRDAEIAGLRTALNQLLIKVDWNSDEFANLKQYKETRAIILDALAPKKGPSE